MNKLTLALIALALSGVAQAKLPPPSEEAKAAAAAAREKAAHGAKIADYQLCLAQDKTAAYYFKTKGEKKPETAVAPCTNPGPFVASAASASAAPAAPAAAAPAAAASAAATKK
jgi:hypothetical protein